MGSSDRDNPEASGRRTAERAIAAGAPRWGVLGPRPRGETLSAIDASSGLPVIVSSATTPELQEELRRFIAGHNAEIRRALDAGESTVDFRPFLLTDDAFSALLRDGDRHVLAPGQPLDLLGGDVCYEVHVPRTPKKPPRFRPPATPSVRRIDENGKGYVCAYEGAPMSVVSRDGEILALGSESGSWFTTHVRTGIGLQHFQTIPLCSWRADRCSELDGAPSVRRPAVGSSP